MRRYLCAEKPHVFRKATIIVASQWLWGYFSSPFFLQLLLRKRANNSPKSIRIFENVSAAIVPFGRIFVFGV